MSCKVKHKSKNAARILESYGYLKKINWTGMDAFWKNYLLFLGITF